jgi:2-amino-4-hydroxy-6-hydroxymethyldihydropteridine diphosphokinase
MPGKCESAVAYLGLGSNLGDRIGALRAAVAALAGHPQINIDRRTGIASLFETSPVGGPTGQGPFLNSALRANTTLSPASLLDVLLSTEKTLGRTRRTRWDARCIDIDLLLYDDLVISDNTLSLPHPVLAERRFVLEPLGEIAGEVVHPVLKVSIATLTQQRRSTPHTSETVTLAAGRDWCC